MKKIIARLTNSDLQNNLYNTCILIFRVAVSIELMVVHGLKKIGAGGNELELVANPFSLPPSLNQFLAAISVLVFPLLIIVGLGTRLATLPVLTVTLTGYFVMHAGDILELKDPPFMYSISFLLILIIGAGKFSLDHYIYRLVNDKKAMDINIEKALIR